MESVLTTDAELTEILAELSSREPIFHRPELGTNRTDFEMMTLEDFWEVGASGRRYTRKYVLEVRDLDALQIDVLGCASSPLRVPVESEPTFAGL